MVTAGDRISSGYWKARPDVMVRELFEVEPDKWQDDALRLFPTSPRLAMKACAGPGKTCVLAWMGWMASASELQRSGLATLTLTT